jgi:LruC domain-containing protein
MFQIENISQKGNIYKNKTTVYQVVSFLECFWQLVIANADIMRKLLFTSIIATLLLACSKDLDQKIVTSSPSQNMCDVHFPENFNFSTTQNLRIHIADQEGVVFRIFGKYKNERDFLASGSSVNGSFLKEMTIPVHYTEIELERWSQGRASTAEYNASPNGTVINRFIKKKSKAQTQTGGTDVLYGINSMGDFFTIDLSDYSSNMLSSPMQGSIALAVDTANDKVYYHRHPNMYSYDINTATHSLHASYNAPFSSNYPRMEYNHNDGYLYVAKNSTLYVIDPADGSTVSSYNITGIVNDHTGGDLAFPPDGNIYMSCFSGLYTLTFNGGTAQATRLSAENFPFQLTSLGYDRNSFLYAGTNESNSRLIKIDPQDGSWVVVKTFNHSINDLGSVSCPVSALPQTDCDNDGVIDALDAAPCDPDIAHEEFTPSQLGTGSLGFEDLWPAKGDYDFNDLVVRYRFIKYLNTNNEMVKLQAKFQVKAIGASLHNGFGLELDVDPSQVQSVTGAKLTQNMISTDSKGLETGHLGKSVIIVFDDAFDQLNHPGGGVFINTESTAPVSVADTITITVDFIQPIASNGAGEAPFNPFIFVDGDRTREVHLADYEPTAKQSLSMLGSVEDDSQPGIGKYYRSEKNLPWAINISHEFRHPLEKKRIDEAYNHFVNWAASSGNNYPDWYKDNGGYRNTSNLYLH